MLTRLLLTMSIVWGTVTASVLQTTSTQYLPANGPLNGTVDGTSITALCVDYTISTPMPATLYGRRVTLDQAVTEGQFNATQARALAYFMTGLTEPGYRLGAISQVNPLDPVSNLAVEVWQYAAWEVISPGATPARSGLASSPGGSVWVNSETLAAAAQSYLSGLTPTQYTLAVPHYGNFSVFIPNSYNQRFLLAEPVAASLMPSPEPSLTIIGAGLMALSLLRIRK